MKAFNIMPLVVWLMFYPLTLQMAEYFQKKTTNKILDNDTMFFYTVIYIVMAVILAIIGIIKWVV